METGHYSAANQQSANMDFTYYSNQLKDPESANKHDILIKNWYELLRIQLASDSNIAI